MRRPLLLVLLFIAGCDRPQPESPQPEARPAAAEASSPCQSRRFEGARFTVCAEPGGQIEVHSAPADGLAYRSFNALAMELGDRADDVAFAMNAGMFDSDGDAIGLLIEQGEQRHAINRREGSGNFHLLPNGVFLVRSDGSAEVVTAERFEPADDIAYASQSGPMLLIDGKLHPAFDEDGESRHLRNGVGIAPDGTPLFVISNDPVSFGKMARFFRDTLDVRNALYFDGAVSSLWEPRFGRMDLRAPIGPMVVVFDASEAAGSAEERR